MHCFNRHKVQKHSNFRLEALLCATPPHGLQADVLAVKQEQRMLNGASYHHS